ncbi:tyrosine-type recombinase/integrase [Shewanella sp. A32]|uniref:tyrosine-type recombinase/integrase n=1 Tax=Shewanella sp. A32 TaxID=3031327 RepID=UPI0023B919D4|nr:site-specific integrase [Shewanella sp. A32]MDF0534927.1 tyrosine-type recombinase/integrase [Shewanella sp. A32]
MYPRNEVQMGKLYDKHLKVLLGKSQDNVKTLSDGDGLGARVSIQGKIRWQFRYKIDGSNKRLDLGDYPEVSLVKARDLTQQCRTWLADGYDPKLQRDVERQATLKPVTVKDALEYWLVNYAEENRVNAERHRAQFVKHIYPYIGRLPLDQTETRHWLECFDRIRSGIPGKQRPAPVATGYVFQNAKQALRFCRVRRYAISRELDDLTIPDVGSKQRRKDRVLSDSEFNDVLIHIQSRKCNRYYADLIWLLVVFGARSQEVRCSTWDEWDFEKGLWTVPRENSKTSEVILRPIPDALRPWLLRLKARNQKGGYLLGEYKNPEAVSAFGGNVWKRLNHKEKWTLHDLRRTLATRLNDLGVLPHVVEHLLGHTVSGVAGIYNRSQYMNEKRAALDMWLRTISPDSWDGYRAFG